MYTEKDLFSNNDEQNRGNFDTDVGILELFGKEPLENLQSIISKVTGLGFVTADFRGEPLTCMTEFTPFCKFTRERGNNGKLCNLSDAFGKPSMSFYNLALNQRNCSVPTADTKKPNLYETQK